MAQQLITVGNVAGDGTGDPLRDAFTKINENFTELYSGNVQITSANIQVYTVAGRTGNIVLTVNDVAQAASKAYVNSAISSNISTVTASIGSTNSNVLAVNLAVISQESRISTLESNASAQALQINNLVSVKANIDYVDTSIAAAISGNAQSANIVSLQANVAAANAAIITKANLSGATFSGNIEAPWISTLESLIVGNIIVAGTAKDEDVQQWANPAALFFGNTYNTPGLAGSRYFQINLQNKDPLGSGDLVVTADDGNDASNYINVGINNSLYNDPLYPLSKAHDGYLYMAGGNLNLWTNTVNDVADIHFWTRDIQRLTISSNGKIYLSDGVSFVFPDGTIQTTAFGGNSNVSSINANITAANIAISNLQSNAVVQALQIDALISNAGSQGSSLNTILANLGTVNINTNTLLANAGVQALSIDLINANIGSYQVFANANAAAQAVSLSSLIANATVQSLAIDNLIANSGAQGASINSINANIGAYQTWANSQPSSTNVLSANIGAYQLYANANAAVQTLALNTINANLVAMNLAIAAGPNLQAVSSNILPSANVTYSLGSADKQWKDLWVSSNTIYIGGTAVTVQNGNLLVGGNQVGAAVPAFDFGTFGAPINYTLDLGTF